MNKITALHTTGAVSLATVLGSAAMLAVPASASTLPSPLVGSFPAATFYGVAAGGSTTFQASYWNTARRYEVVPVKVTGKSAAVSSSSIVLPASGAKVPVTVTVKVPAGTAPGSVSDTLTASSNGKTVTYGFTVVVPAPAPPPPPPPSITCAASDFGNPAPSWLPQSRVVQLLSTSGYFSSIPAPWTLTFNFPGGYLVTSASGLAYTQNGTQVTITGNADILGSSESAITVGYAGPPLGSGGVLTNFAINGVACSPG